MTNLPYSPAAERNRKPILEQLSGLMPATGTVLEIGSGTGQHAIFFSEHLPQLHWQPSDRQQNLAVLEACLLEQNCTGVFSPMQLDVLSDPWPKRLYEAVYSANTAHIMSWEAVQAMFAGVSRCLVGDARFFLYGPFNIEGKFTSESNRQFDFQLRCGDPQMGIRDMADLETLANDNQMLLEQHIAMPANNFLMVFKRT